MYVKIENVWSQSDLQHCLNSAQPDLFELIPFELCMRTLDSDSVSLFTEVSQTACAAILLNPHLHRLGPLCSNVLQTSVLLKPASPLHPTVSVCVTVFDTL